MRFVLCAMVLLLGLGTASAQEYTYNGHVYKTVSGNWDEAQQNAVNWGGNLVTINNLAEGTWLQQTFGAGTIYWIGFTDRQKEGDWQWVSGEPVTYTDWASGQPDNFLALLGGEDYAVMNWGTARKWNDVWPIIARTGIAEKFAPEPVSALLFGTGGVALYIFRKRRPV